MSVTTKKNIDRENADVILREVKRYIDRTDNPVMTESDTIQALIDTGWLQTTPEPEPEPEPDEFDTAEFWRDFAHFDAELKPILLDGVAAYYTRFTITVVDPDHLALLWIIDLQPSPEILIEIYDGNKNIVNMDYYESQSLYIWPGNECTPAGTYWLVVKSANGQPVIGSAFLHVGFTDD
ncbi:MAG: hypothetical protein LBP59_10700 [Planctomycetaceae bacterium]|jgi:hypothetical protein|nr:hypothetical protein [Planctomycetaceae bacterium]